MYRQQRIAQSVFAEYNGIVHHIRHWAGSGAKVFLLHGWMDCSASFQFMVDALGGDWDIYALDWRGMGLSAHQSGGYYDRMMMLADLHLFLQQFSPDAPVHLFGHSLGGMLASQFAGLFPGRTASLIVAEGFGLPDGAVDGCEEKLARFIRGIETPPPFAPVPDYAAFAQKLMQRNPLLEESRALFLAGNLLEKETSGSLKPRADARHKIPQPQPYRLQWYRHFWQKITAPVLWIRGGEVAHNPYLAQLKPLLPEIYAAYGSPQVCVIGESGHMLQWEAPEKTAACARDFWQKILQAA